MVAAEVCAGLDRTIFDPLCLTLFSGRGLMPDILREKRVPCASLKRGRATRLLGPVLPAIILRRLKIDILHIHHVPFFLSTVRAAKLAGIPHICLTEHSWLSISKSQRLKEGCRMAAQKAGFFSVISRELKNRLVAEAFIPESLIAVIPNGVDTTVFSPQNPSQSIRDLVPEGFKGKIIVCVGRLVEEKDYGNLFSALECLKKIGRDDFHLVLVGDGGLRKSLEEQVKRKGLSACATFAGIRTDINKLLPGADLFVMSSKSEGLPVALLEAMACGLPVIATSVGGIPEVVENGKNGLLVPPGDSNALAAEIDRALNDLELARQLGRNARKMVEQSFSRDKMVGEYTNLYLKLFDKKE